MFLSLLGGPAKDISKCGLCLLMYIMYMSGICRLVAMSASKNVTTTELKREELDSFSFSS